MLDKPKTWTPVLTEQLREWWNEEGVAATVIQKRFKDQGFDVSRSAIIAKAHRIGCNRRIAPNTAHFDSLNRRAPQRERAVSVARPSVARDDDDVIDLPPVSFLGGLKFLCETIEEPEEPKAPEGGIGFMELRSTTCHFPLWGHKERPCVDDLRYCGVEIDPVDSYCADHKKLCFTPAVGPSRKKRHFNMTNANKLMTPLGKLRAARALAKIRGRV